MKNQAPDSPQPRKGTERTVFLPQASPPNNRPQNKDLEDWMEKYAIDLTNASYEGDASRLVAAALLDLATILSNKSTQLASQEKMNHE